MGHSVDELNYLQIIHEPETVTREWEKLRVFLDSGVDTETREEMEALRERVREPSDEHRHRFPTHEADARASWSQGG